MPKRKSTEGEPGSASRDCLHCPAYDLAICRTAMAARGAYVREAIEQEVHWVSARRVAFRYREARDIVPVICHGWASRDISISGGGRMILSFFFPGELMGDTVFVEPHDDGFIEAITDIQYRTFERSAFRRIAIQSAESISAVLRDCIGDRAWSDRLIVDLGRRSAELRVTRLILRLVERLKARELEDADAQLVSFPLRHRHIADATGLSPEHVTKVLSDLRRRNIMTMHGRELAIHDPLALERLARD